MIKKKVNNKIDFEKLKKYEEILRPENLLNYYEKDKKVKNFLRKIGPPPENLGKPQSK